MMAAKESGPIEEVDTSPETPVQGRVRRKTEETAGNMISAIFDMLKEQGADIKSVHKRIDELDEKMDRMGKQFDLLHNETRANATRLAEADSRCASRCKILRRIMGDESKDPVTGKEPESHPEINLQPSRKQVEDLLAAENDER